MVTWLKVNGDTKNETQQLILFWAPVQASPASAHLDVDMIMGLFGFLGLLLGCVGAFVIVRFSQDSLLDIPNERSSHKKPIPRGGGIGFVAGFFLGFWMSPLPLSQKWACALGLLLVAAVGFWDDRRPLPAWTRLIIHFLAVIPLAIEFPLTSTLLPIIPAWTPISAQIALTAFWAVSAINLTNFLDGIDGFAASHGVWIGGWLFFVCYPTLPLGGIFALSCLGFLLFNWPPARVFMGDVGSGALGFGLGCLPLFTPEPNPEALLWLGIASAFFWGDAVFTLVARLVRGQKFWQAHREHSYQKLVDSGWGHQSVCFYYLGLSIASCLVIYFGCGQPHIDHVLAILFLAWSFWMWNRFYFGRKRQ